MDNKLIGTKITNYMEQKGVTIEELAYMIDLNSNTLKNKLQGDGKFYVTDIIKIKEALKMSLEEFEDIFFNLK